MMRDRLGLGTVWGDILRSDQIYSIIECMIVKKSGIIQVLKSVSKKTLVSWICSILILVEFSVVVCSVNQYYVKKLHDINQTPIDSNQTIFVSGDLNLSLKLL